MGFLKEGRGVRHVRETLALRFLGCQVGSELGLTWVVGEGAVAASDSVCTAAKVVLPKILALFVNDWR